MKFKKYLFPIFAILAVAVFFSACDLVGNIPGVTPGTNFAPRADAGLDQTLEVGQQAVLNGINSSDADGDTLTYSWQILAAPPGSTASLSNADEIIAYLTPDIAGLYIIQLTVSDGSRTGNDMMQITATSASNTPPTAVVEVVNDPDNDGDGDPYTYDIGDEVSFDGSSSSDPDGSITNYAWDFDDGNFGSGQTATHRYWSAGSFTITLTVTDNLGGTDSTQVEITVNPSSGSVPTADAGPDQTVNEGQSVSFDGSNSDDAEDGNSLTYSWNFGDGTTGSGMTTSHTYNTPGNYTVTLTVTDSDSNQDSDQCVITVLDTNTAPVAAAGSDQTVDVGQVVDFDGTGSYDTDGVILSYFWVFGDGTTGSGAQPSHIYGLEGSYTVTLTVTDDDGAQDSDSLTVTVNPTPNIPPVADAGEDQVVNRDDTVEFDGSGSKDDDGSIVSYSWDFGDGSTGSGESTTHSYTTSGAYTVTLTVTDNEGALDSDTMTVLVRGALLVNTTSNTGNYGYNQSYWPGMTAELNSAFDNDITVVPDLENLDLMMAFDALWVDQRWTNGTLTQTEINNIKAFAATGRMVVMIGENSSWSTWNNQILGIAGGSFSGSSSGDSDAIFDHPITNNASTVYIAGGGTAAGGISLYDQNFATLWGDNKNILTVLDVNIFDNYYWSYQSNQQFSINVANWLAAGQVDVAILPAEAGSVAPEDVKAKLEATGKFSSVSIVNVYSETPTLDDLQAFDAVLVWSNYLYSDSAALGDVLADYVDSGGGVVVMMFNFATGYAISGRFNTDNYWAIVPGSRTLGQAYLGTIYDPDHPIMEGVSSFDGGNSSFRPSGNSLAAGAERIADWTDGNPLIVTREIGGARRVDLGFYPVSSTVASSYWQASTDGDLIMANSLLWAAGATGGPVIPKLKVHVAQSGETVSTLVSMLAGMSNVESVDNADYQATTPTVEDLLAYDAVIVTSNNTWADSTTMGNVLADYVDQGGRIILTGATLHDNLQGTGGWVLRGAIAGSTYSPVAITNYTITWKDATNFIFHDITSGVTSISSWLNSNAATTQGSGVSLGTYSDGTIVGAYNPNEPVVMLNIWVNDNNFATGDVDELIENTLEWLFTNF
jgi:PKD repeat protein